MPLFAEAVATLALLAAGEAPRVLEGEFAAVLEKRVAKQCAAQVLELRWGAESATAGTLRRLPSASDGKQFYVLWLKDRYGYNIARLNAAYGLEAASFTDLAESDFRTLDAEREAVRKDDASFARELEETLRQRVEEMFQASCGAPRRVRWGRNTDQAR